MLNPMKNSQKFHLPDSVVQHSPGDLREPIIKPGKQRKNGAADENVMKVRDHEEGVVHLQVKRHRGDHHAGQTAEHEQHNKAEDEEQRCPVDDPPLPEGGEPAEDLNAAGYRHHHARAGEEAGAELRQARREHVMHPEPEREKRGRDQGQDQRQVSENWPAGEGRDYRRNHAGRRQKDDVNLRMAKEPEKVLP